MSTDRDTLIELAKRENENNHNQNTNDSIGGVDSAIEQKNSPYSDNPEITVNQPQFTEKHHREMIYVYQTIILNLIYQLKLRILKTIFLLQKLTTTKLQELSPINFLVFQI